MDADLPGLFLHKFDDSASESQMLVIRMNRQSRNLPKTGAGNYSVWFISRN